MTIAQRDKRAIVALGAALALAGIYWLASPSSSSPAGVKLVAAADTVELAERRLALLRAAAATVPGKEQVYKQAAAAEAQRERGLIQADTAAQAQAQLLQIVKRLAKNGNPPIEIRQIELREPEQFGGAFGEVGVAVSFDCSIYQLVNLLADLSAQPEIVSTGDIRIGAAQPKQKTMPVRITVSGIVPKKLVREKKAMAAF